MECLNCYTADMQEPQNNHPAYVECPNCGAIELTFEPQDYQSSLFQLDVKEMQIIGVFGG